MDKKVDVKKEDREQRESFDHKGQYVRKKNHKFRRQGHRHRDADNFKGDNTELAGYVYTYDSVARADQYEKTTEHIAEYLKHELLFPDDIHELMTTLEEPDIDTWMPNVPKVKAGEDDTLQKAVFTEEVKEYMLRKRTFSINKSKSFSIIMGQCSPSIRSRLKGQEDWKDMQKWNNIVRLLKSIKMWMMNQQETQCPTVSTLLSIMALFVMRQNKYESLDDFRTRFEVSVQVLEHMGVDLGRALVKRVDKLLAEKGLTRDDSTDEQIKEAEKKAYEKLQAVAFLMAADKTKYEPVLAFLENHYGAGNDHYPMNITEAYNRLCYWRNNTASSSTPYNDGITFAQDGMSGGSAKKGPRDRSADRCHRCGEIGHHQWEGKCEDKDADKPQATMNVMSTPADEDDKQADSSDGNEGYEFAFCTLGVEAREFHEGELLSQAGELKQEIQTNSFNKKRASVLPPGSVGLDSMSSVDIFGEARLLTDIHGVQENMRIMCNAGTVVVNHMGTLKGYGSVWYHPDAIANILSLSNVQDKFRVTYDSSRGNCFIVHRPDGTQRVFMPTDNGLYASNVNSAENGVIMVSTVAENVKSFTKREVKRAEQARRLMAVIGRPSESKMCTILNNRQLMNSDACVQDVINARLIFGPDVGSLKGKTVREKEPHVDITITPIPTELMERHRHVVVCFDIMYVNRVVFLVSISRALKFCTAEALKNRRIDTILTGMQRIKTVYTRRGFVMDRALGDNEFISLDTGLAAMGIMLNTVSRDEHVPEIERHIRTLKERCRSVYNALPFKKLPSRMVVELVYSSTFWIHAFPATDGVSSVVSPRELVTGVAIDARKHCVIPFGAYVQTHEQHDNSMASRTIGAIALRPTGNVQGGHYFFNLQTGKKIVRNRWTEIPMPKEVVERVNQMAENRAMNELVFGDRDNDTTHEAESDETEESSSSDDSSTSDTDSPGSASDHDEDQNAAHDDEDDDEPPTSAAESENEWADAYGGEPQYEQTPRRVRFAPEVKVDPHAAFVKTEPEGTDTDEPQHEEQSEQHGASDPIHAEPENHGNSSTENSNSDANAPEEPQNSAVNDIGGVSLDEQMDQQYGKRSGAHNLRPRRKPNYDLSACVQAGEHVVAPRFNVSALATLNSALEPLIGVVLTQHGVNKGLKIFGARGDDAVRREMQQLHDRSVMRPKSGSELSPADKHAALRYLMFLKEKRDGNIKGRGCADGRKQREYIRKEETSSPTISTEAVLIIITIAAKEKRDVASVDLPGAFMQTELDGEKVTIKFEGRMVELLAMIDPKLYRPHVIIERGKPVLYAELCKVLYGMLQAALKFWRQVSQDLRSLGYEINPYDWCVANKQVNGKQHTVGWHVDDFLLTHEDPTVNDGLIQWFSEKYGRLSPLTVHRGHTHEYLGMTIHFEQPKCVVITMENYVERLINEAPGEWAGTATTPAGKHLFDINDGATTLDEERARLFHHMVAKALFLSKRARPDIQLTVSFLCTRVRAPDEDDWRKLRRLILYLRDTAKLPLTLQADDTRIIKWWIDAAYAVHNDCKSQSGAAMTLGRGMTYSSSVRQKINTRSSTEAELVGVNDFMPQVLWTRYFLEAQGYDLRDNLVYQDNQSAILLEENGKGSSSKRTRHINIRFFFVTDRVQAGELSIKYCPTEEMVADFFTKPLQGAQFRKLRNIVLNIDDPHD